MDPALFLVETPEAVMLPLEVVEFQTMFVTRVLGRRMRFCLPAMGQ